MALNMIFCSKPHDCSAEAKSWSVYEGGKFPHHGEGSERYGCPQCSIDLASGQVWVTPFSRLKFWFDCGLMIATFSAQRQKK
jgi:hypothetical protein